MNGTTSKHLRSTTELTLIANIKPGFVEIDQPLSYSSRLKILLKGFFEARQRNVEQSESSSYVGPLERLGSLHFVRWSVFDNDQRLLLAISFDRPWESYIRLIVDKAGPILDVIFIHCDDFEGFACYDGYPQFAKWVRKHQINCDFFYSGNPDTSVDDIRYLKEVEKLTRTKPETKATLQSQLADLHVSEPELKLEGRERLGSLARLARLGELFPTHKSGPGLTDRQFFDRAARELLAGLKPNEELTFEPPKPERRDGVDAVKLYETKKLDNVQGGVLKGYGPSTHGCLALVRFTDAERGAAFIDCMADTVSTLGNGKTTDTKTNVALTYDGLKKLGLQQFQLEQFPKEFREGMEARAGLLGDVGSAHPNNWTRPEYNSANSANSEGPGGVVLSTVDAVVILQTTSDANPKDEPEHTWSEQHPLYEHLKGVETTLPDAMEILHVQPVYRQVSTGPDNESIIRGHFGFVDGISQPRPLDADATERDRVPLGEMLLGYPNARREVASYRNAQGHEDPEHDFFKDGTFLVVRKLRQNVEAFEKYLGTNAQGNKDYLAAKLMGRGKDGEIFDGSGSLTPAPKRNDFNYEDDARGRGCPMRSHVRLANPRETREDVDGNELQTPRIARRGFSYGPTKKEEPGDRGLVFLAYCASIADQYEIIQRWLNGGNSTGLLSAHNDVLTGPSSWNTKGSEKEQFTLHVNGVLEDLPRDDPFVTLEWGTYLFVPSTAGLKRIASASKSATEEAPASDPIAHIGETIIAQLNHIASRDETRGKQEWQKVMEDVLFVRDRTAVWAAIRARGGVLKTPYGVLVGTADHVKDVFTDEEHYSVREYWQRTNDTLGAAYLGMDRNPQPMQGESSPRDKAYETAVRDNLYEEFSKEPNKYMLGISGTDAFKRAQRATAEYIDKTLPHPIDLRALSAAVTAAASTYWFGLPGENEKHMEIGNFDLKPDRRAKCPLDFITSSRYIFFPHPAEWVRDAAQKSGGLIRKAVTAFFDTKSQDPTLRDELGKTYMHDERAWRERAVATAVSGFMAATIGSFLSVMRQWTLSGELWRLQQRVLREEATPTYESLLSDEMTRAMRKVPFPDLLYRTVLKPKALGSGGQQSVSLEPGDRVVVSLASASSDLPELSDELLFGGSWDDKRKSPETSPVHPCPGREMARGVMLGMIREIMDRKDLRDVGTLVLATSGQRATRVSQS